MTIYKRIKDPATGAEYTYDEAKIAALGLDEFVIDKDPLDASGRPARWKPSLPLGTSVTDAAKASVKSSGAKGSGKVAAETGDGNK